MNRLLRNSRGSITLEFAICGVMFIGIVLGMLVMGLWMYNSSQARQAARIAAMSVAVNDDPAEARNAALNYLDKTLVACPVKNAGAYGSMENGHGIVEVEMAPLFPGFQRLIDPRGKSAANGMILIRKEALAAREQRFRQGSQ